MTTLGNEILGNDAKATKKRAHAIKSRLQELGQSLTLGQAYEILATSCGFRNWPTMKASIERAEAEATSEKSFATCWVCKRKTPRREYPKGVHNPCGAGMSFPGCEECTKHRAVTPSHAAWFLAAFGMVGGDTGTINRDGMDIQTDAWGNKYGTAIHVLEEGIRYVPLSSWIGTASQRAATLEQITSRKTKAHRVALSPIPGANVGQSVEERASRRAVRPEAEA